MNKKIVPFILLIVLALLVFVLRQCTGNNSNPPEPQKETKSNNAAAKQRGFNRTVSSVEYTAHARCRMDCRKISGADIKEIMRGGKINYRKSDVQDKPCPTYALEGYTTDNEHLRVVFAQCNTTTKVVTCINLKEDFDCYCQGDKKEGKQ